SEPFSFELALTIVMPLSSWINCAYMFLFERNTFRRGMLLVPLILLRTWPCILLRTAFLFVFAINSSCLLSALYALLSCFTFFLTYIFAFITNTFPFIRFRWTNRSDIRCYCTNQFFIDSFYNNLSVFWFINFYTMLCFNLNWVRITSVHNKFISLFLCTITDTDDFKFFLKTFRNTFDHIPNNTSSCTVQ